MQTTSLKHEYLEDMTPEMGAMVNGDMTSAYGSSCLSQGGYVSAYGSSCLQQGAYVTAYGSSCLKQGGYVSAYGSSCMGGTSAPTAQMVLGD